MDSNLRLPTNPLGMENMKIKDGQITSSGNQKDGNIECYAYYARLNTDKCWVANQPVKKTSYYFPFLNIT